MPLTLPSTQALFIAAVIIGIYCGKFCSLKCPFGAMFCRSNSSPRTLMKIADLDREIRSCAKCEEILRKWPVDPCVADIVVGPRPILSQPRVSPVMLIGQAPGPTEYRSGLPFTGGAGDKIKSIFAQSGLPTMNFDEFVYQTSVVKCFPGRKINSTSGRAEDRVPCRVMTNSCSPFLAKQIDLCNPSLIVTLGGFAANGVNRLAGFEIVKLGKLVGNKVDWNNRTVIYFPHTSGTNRFLNSPVNVELFNRAKKHLSEWVREFGNH